MTTEREAAQGSGAGWPDWLRAADTKDACVEIRDGRVIWLGGDWLGGTWLGGDWLGGTWHGGTWQRGIWRGGVWRVGVWRGGTWENGVWENGVWLDGDWRGGDWRGGVWRGGAWHGGAWHGGASAATRASHRVIGWLSDGDIIISVGCQTKPAADWLAIIDGRTEAPDKAPKRGSRAWLLLEAAIRAQIAYQQTLAAG